MLLQDNGETITPVHGSGACAYINVSELEQSLASLPSLSMAGELTTIHGGDVCVCVFPVTSVIGV